MKAPEEIKKGLEFHYVTRRCKDCPYTADEEFKKTCFQLLSADAFAYIQQLESRLAQAERERDAMLLALKEVGCWMCKNAPSQNDIYIQNECLDCVKKCNFEWRGVCPENTKEA